jgi:hypothetical protein
MPSKKSSAFCQYLYYIAFAGVFLRGEINKCAVNGYKTSNRGMSAGVVFKNRKRAERFCAFTISMAINEV